MTKRDIKLRPIQEKEKIQEEVDDTDFGAEDVEGEEFDAGEFDVGEFDAEGIEGFDGGCDAASFGDFDPMQALGQLLVTQEGETIPDVLTGIRQSIDTLTKVLHKMSKQLDKK